VKYDPQRVANGDLNRPTVDNDLIARRIDELADVAGTPLTMTRPARTSVSALRRDATPARANARWMRIGSAISDRLWLWTQRDREFLGAGKFFQVTKGKVLEEERRRPVEEWTTDPLSARHDVDQPPLLQRLDDRTDN
jgi:hypothetical protein